jgi:hypothetical protein
MTCSTSTKTEATIGINVSIASVVITTETLALLTKGRERDEQPFSWVKMIGVVMTQVITITPPLEKYLFLYKRMNNNNVLHLWKDRG